MNVQAQRKDETITESVTSNIMIDNDIDIPSDVDEEERAAILLSLGHIPVPPPTPVLSVSDDVNMSSSDIESVECVAAKRLRSEQVEPTHPVISMITDATSRYILHYFGNDIPLLLSLLFAPERTIRISTATLLAQLFSDVYSTRSTWPSIPGKETTQMTSNISPENVINNDEIVHMRTDSIACNQDDSTSVSTTDLSDETKPVIQLQSPNTTIAMDIENIKDNNKHDDDLNTVNTASTAMCGPDDDDDNDNTSIVTIHPYVLASNLLLELISNKTFQTLAEHWRRADAITW
eukprot:CAMPEP_0182440556 /NCGR_PEP_ID=MMETSP1167-20130531/87141_1 /TAXON_ID=2988 /ORGANISM="Mallomonas Sp, Strain CCMP3275" /LENGTH=291 /DNA_ID=CAMNT_0024634547 /DNA_START=1204 /DNA_END=2076 /DNA_ORIENTATION=-